MSLNGSSTLCDVPDKLNR